MVITGKAESGERMVVASVETSAHSLATNVQRQEDDQPIAPLASVRIRHFIPAAIDELLKLNGMRLAAVLVSCGKTKATGSTSAEQMYISSLFQSSMALARRLSPSRYILSALYGLLLPDEAISPYELKLSQLAFADRMAWGRRVTQQLLVRARPTTVLSLAGKTYNDSLAPALGEEGIELRTPLAGLGLGRRMAVLKAARRIYSRVDLAEALYASLATAAKHGGRSTLREVISARSLPKRGIYIFMDPTEESAIFPGQPRIVRIGTHAVAMKSNSTLRTRLRTHLGQADLGGSHRSSVFRLHIGRALMRAGDFHDPILAWGVGSTASQDQRKAERALEEKVSGYVARLLVSVVEITDNPSPSSLRAITERALIALFTEERRYLETPSPQWLGNHSDKPEISSSGLWNIQHCGKVCDLQAVRLVVGLIDKSVSIIRTTTGTEEIS